ncbi:MAG: hypothetical protein LBB14_00205 [Puniceicoccales bacterium]|nr:hypothetical protein [Puniceicoccales bacterium]
MVEISAYGVVSRLSQLERRMEEKTADDGDGAAIEDVPGLFLEVASEFGIGKVAIAICRIIYVLIGWLVNFFNGLFGGEDELPEEYEELVKDVKGIAERDGRPRNREKYVLRTQLREICDCWTGGSRDAWKIMRAIRKLPKDRLTAVTGSTLRRWTDSLNSALGLELQLNGNGEGRPVPAETQAALDAVLKKHAKEVPAEGGNS